MESEYQSTVKCLVNLLSKTQAELAEAQAEAEQYKRWWHEANKQGV